MAQEKEVTDITPEMIAAGYQIFGPFNRDIWEQTDPQRVHNMLRAVFTGMRAVEMGADVKSGTRAGLALYPFATSE